jgi:type VI secretion system secreted protein Hcp
MAIDSFLWFEASDNTRPIKGETQDETYGKAEYKAIEITSFSFGIENATTIGSSSAGAGSGKAVLGKFTIEKLTDNCTPDFFIACGTGGHYTKAHLVLRKVGGSTSDKTQRVPFIQYDFSLVFVSKLDWKGAKDDEAPSETIEFAYGALKITYTPQDKNGKPITPQKIACWNQVNNNQSDTVT